MLTIIYVIAACIVTPLLYEWVNRQRIGTSNRFVNIIKGWPAYAVNVIICIVIGLTICVAPGGPGFYVPNWFLVTAAIYFGNQFVYNTFIKILAKTRKRI